MRRRCPNGYWLPRNDWSTWVSVVARNSRSLTLGTGVSVMILYADPVIAAGLAAVLDEHNGFRVVPTREPHDLVGSPPLADVVLADYETGVRLAESAPQWANNVLVFTNYDSEAKICRALESGARGYLLCGVALTELFEGIRSVYRGGVTLSPIAAARITNCMRGESLTPREKTVLEQLMLGLRDKMIASKLSVSVGTVKCHVKSILEKLGAVSRTQAVVTAQRRGLLP
jgi:DNA-binding NarL/FixJ family response regulator